MPSYLVETYVPRAKAHEVEATGVRLRAVVADLQREGTPVRFVRTTLLPDDETCFHVLDAPSTADVELVCRRAGLVRVRVVTAVEEPSAISELASGDMT